MNDPIGEWVDASLQRLDRQSFSIGTCRHCGNSWHGKPFNGCPGSHVTNLSDVQLEAIESQGVLDWTSDIFVRGED